MWKNPGVYIASKTADVKLPTIFMLHGAGGNAESLLPLMGLLEGKANMVALNLPGMGRQIGPVMERVESLAAYVAGFIAGRSVQPWLLGHSLGSAVALQVAKDWPELLNGLILLNPAPSLPLNDRFMDHLSEDASGTLQSFLRKAFGSSADEGLMESSITMVCSMPEDTLIGDFQACRTFDANPYLKDIKLPCLIVAGEEDEINRPEEARKMGEMMDRATFIIVEKVGHMAPQQKPDKLAHEIDKFIASIES